MTNDEKLLLAQKVVDALTAKAIIHYEDDGFGNGGHYMKVDYPFLPEGMTRIEVVLNAFEMLAK